ncbi:MAG TPA: hypothetical protein PKX11_01645 [Methanospirillum sp.]|jgi:hypothetical protein|uniref:hypothetical protein n=1 Tax=Methanospirillum sp. TaxID=45200 RepID=UPI0016BC2E28|nr:hypothetical protein [Methanospirillum sp.]NLD98698.1 hypothetical protein [Fibrobacter sp.]HQB99240.1 hypothetical protein [Methanospirillum sp.]
MSTQITIDSYRDFYFSIFLPAYADLTGYTLEKHKAVLYSIDSANSHLMQYLSPTLEQKIREENIRKAFTHLERATLDCYKLMWLHVESDLKSLISDKEKRVLCVNMGESDLLYKYHKATNAILESRKHELQNIGINLQTTIEKYRDAIEITKKIIENIDPIALDMVDIKRRRSRWIEIIFAFIIGILSTIASQPILKFLFP